MSGKTMNICLEFGADLLDDEAWQDVHDEASQSGIHGEGLDDGAHEQHGERTLLHQLLHHHRQNLRRVHVPLPEAEVSSCRTNTEHVMTGCRTYVWLTESLLICDEASFNLHQRVKGVSFLSEDLCLSDMYQLLRRLGVFLWRQCCWLADPVSLLALLFL